MGNGLLRRADLEITHMKGSGPGGQNRNKRLTGIRMVHLPTGMTVVSTERRSQEQNLAAAYERMEEKLRRFFHKPKPRFETRRTKGSTERRIQAKRVRSQNKQGRSRVRGDSEF